MWLVQVFFFFFLWPVSTWKSQENPGTVRVLCHAGPAGLHNRRRTRPGPGRQHIAASRASAYNVPVGYQCNRRSLPWNITRERMRRTSNCEQKNSRSNDMYVHISFSGCWQPFLSDPSQIIKQQPSSYITSRVDFQDCREKTSINRTPIDGLR
jgi:hypothetical protein